MLKPEILSVHYTARCDRNCNGCYLKRQVQDIPEIQKQEWLQLPMVASELGIRKIAIAFNYLRESLHFNERYFEFMFLVRFVEECDKFGISVDITTERSMAEYFFDFKIRRMPKKFWNSIDVFSISFDKNKESLDNSKLFQATISKLRRRGIKKFNANCLITKNAIDWITGEHFNLLLKSFDTIHLILEKPFNYTRDEYYTIVEKLESIGVFVDERFIVDPCFLFRLGLTTHCYSCRELIDINPYGNVSGCAYSHKDRPIGTIRKMQDLKEIFENAEEQIITHCEHLEFVGTNEIYESRRNESNSHQ